MDPSGTRSQVSIQLTSAPGYSQSSTISCTATPSASSQAGPQPHLLEREGAWIQLLAPMARDAIPSEAIHASPSPSAAPTSRQGSGSLVRAAANPAGSCQPRGAGLRCWDPRPQEQHHGAAAAPAERVGERPRAWGEPGPHIEPAQDGDTGETQHPWSVPAPQHHSCPGRDVAPGRESSFQPPSSRFHPTAPQQWVRQGLCPWGHSSSLLQALRQQDRWHVLKGCQEVGCVAGASCVCTQQGQTRVSPALKHSPAHSSPGQHLFTPTAQAAGACRCVLPPLAAKERRPQQVTTLAPTAEPCRAGQGQRRLREGGDGSHRQPWCDGVQQGHHSTAQPRISLGEAKIA